MTTFNLSPVASVLQQSVATPIVKTWDNKETPFRLAVFSDIHLGHPRVRTEFILGNLARFWHNPEWLKTVDLIVIAGDLFDRLIYMNQGFVPAIDIFFKAFFQFAKVHDVDIIILEGTPSHDRGQGKRLIDLNTSISQVNANVTYIDTLSIYHDVRRDLHYLFVPDEWHHDTNETWRQVEELLRARKLTQVDFAFMHGNFEYQLPAIAKAPKHNEQNYLRIVRYGIYIGHIHIHSNFDRIYAQGSFDRTAHGEEADKGFYYVVLKDEQFTSTFMVNEHARKFITIDCRGLEIQDALDYIDKRVKDLPDGSHVMLYVYESSALNKTSYIASFYPTLIWKTKTERSLQTGTIETLERDLDYVPIYITDETISDLVKEAFKSQGIESEVTDVALKELELIKEALRDTT